MEATCQALCTFPNTGIIGAVLCKKLKSFFPPRENRLDHQKLLPNYLTHANIFPKRSYNLKSRALLLISVEGVKYQISILLLVDKSSA